MDIPIKRGESRHFDNKCPMKLLHREHMTDDFVRSMVVTVIGHQEHLLSTVNCSSRYLRVVDGEVDKRRTVLRTQRSGLVVLVRIHSSSKTVLMGLVKCHILSIYSLQGPVSLKTTPPSTLWVTFTRTRSGSSSFLLFSQASSNQRDWWLQNRALSIDRMPLEDKVFRSEIKERKRWVGQRKKY